MNNLLVSYDLKAPGRNCKPVHDYLQGFSDCADKNDKSKFYKYQLQSKDMWLEPVK